MHVATSGVNGVLYSPMKREATKRRIKMTNCANKKNRGASVELKTHIFLQDASQNMAL